MSNTIKISELMESSGVKFGTSGARGLVADMTDKVCYAYTLGFIKYLKGIWLSQNSEYPVTSIAIAGDLRQSTPRIMEAVARAAKDSGLTVVNSSTVPSPAVALYGMKNKMPAVMVTGSHIPDDRNGIKYNTAIGEILKYDEIGMKEQVVVLPDIFTVDGMFTENVNALGEPESGARVAYVDRWLKAFPSDFLSGMTVGVYQHSAVGRDIMNLVYSRLGAIIFPIERSDVFIPVDTEAIRHEDVELARRIAGENKLDVIVSTDGDSDRPLISDENGNWLRGDIAGILTASFLNADCVVTPVSSNTAVELCEKFEIVERTKIGSPYVIAILQKLYSQDPQRKVVGYEANGGFLQMSPLSVNGNELEPLPTRDPIIVHLAILGLVKKFGLPISKLVELLPARVGGSDRLQGVATEISTRNISNLIEGGQDCMEAFLPELGKIASIDLTDGLRMVFDNSDIVHLRPSGNAPELRCYVEAETSDRVEYLLEYGLNALKGWL